MTVPAALRERLRQIDSRAIGGTANPAIAGGLSRLLPLGASAGRRRILSTWTMPLIAARPSLSLATHVDRKLWPRLRDLRVGKFESISIPRHSLFEAVKRAALFVPTILGAPLMCHRAVAKTA
ncbi:MAG TPA: hypothetical protein VEF36_13240 [Roseiarcus sp.]|nr:hypothetical protein [Roseiarcus sp.]